MQGFTLKWLIGKGSKTAEPPLTKNITEEDIEYHIVQKSKIIFEAFLCHTQAVKRVIKQVTETSLKVCRSEARNGYIKPIFYSRAKVPSLESKAKYKE